MSINQGGTTLALQEVGAISKAGYVGLFDRSQNSISRTQREKIPSNQEGIMISGKNDDFATFIRTDRKGGVMMGNFTSEIMDSFEGATLNVQKWVSSVSGFAQAQTTLGGYNMTNTTVTTSGSYSILTSKRFISNWLRQPIQNKLRRRIGSSANTAFEYGFGAPATTAVPANGVALRILNGLAWGTIYINSVAVQDVQILSETTDGSNTIGQQFSLLNLTTSYFTYDVIPDDDNIIFTIQNTENGAMMAKSSVPVTAAMYKMFGATALPVYIRTMNTGVAGVAPVDIVSGIQVLSLDQNWNRDFENLAGSLHLTSTVNPFTGAQTENNTNSTAPTSATLSNTTAGYTTLGGKFQFAAVAGAETDYALFGYQVPAGSRVGVANIKIDVYNMGAASATTPTLLEWKLVSNLSAVSLATANGKRTSLGAISIPVGAAIGQYIGSIVPPPFPPEYTESSQFVVIALSMPVGTATASQIIRGTVRVIGVDY